MTAALSLTAPSVAQSVAQSVAVRFVAVRSASPSSTAPPAASFAPGASGTLVRVAALLAALLVPGAPRAAGTLPAERPASASEASDAGAAAVPAAASGQWLARESVQHWIRETSLARGLDRHRVEALFARLEPADQDVIDKMSTPAERTLTWAEYRRLFLGEERVRAGREFVAAHRATLDRAEARFGVPPSIVAAIIGVETLYGRVTGRHGVLGSLATLAFDYPPRAAFFRDELAEFLVLGESEGWDMLEVQGSYAGAMGLPQFIASSYRRYAVDFDGDGRRDLFASVDDAIGSVANYLAEHGWRRGEAVAVAWPVAAAARDDVRALVREPLEPAVAADAVRTLGFEDVSLDAAGADGRRIGVMRMDGEGGEEFWVSYTNFYAITRYNHSRLYALAVRELAAALERVP